MSSSETFSRDKYILNLFRIDESATRITSKVGTYKFILTYLTRKLRVHTVLFT